MSLFGKKHEIDQNLNQAADAEAISSLFDKNMVITGTISFKGKARIDGTINGDITEGDHLILSESGKSPATSGRSPSTATAPSKVMSRPAALLPERPVRFTAESKQRA